MAASAPRFSVSEISTPHRTFDEDVRGYAAGGAEGIGLTEEKLPEGRDGESRALLHRHGLTATICITKTGSILPNAFSAQPADPDHRMELLSKSIRRLAAFQPVTVLLLTGVQGERTAEEARRIAVSGLRELAGVARAAGVKIALEPIHRSVNALFSLVWDIPGAVALLDEVADPSVGIIFDTWHLWDSPGVLEHIRRHARRFPAVHVNDWRNPTRGWDDRALPGEGIIDLPALFGAMEAGGYAGGWYDMEIFSTETYEDSLLTLTAEEMTRRGKAGFMKAWAARHA